MNCVQKQLRARANKETQTKAQMKLWKESSKSGKLREIMVLKQKARPETSFQSSEISAQILLGKYTLNVTNTAQIQPMKLHKVF